MGYITTFSIYNDGAGEIAENKVQLADAIYEALSASKSGSAIIGNHGNLLNFQKPRHADMKTIYVHAGNTVVDADSYGERIQNILRTNPKFFDEIVSVIEDKLDNLKRLKKQVEEEKTQ